MLSKLGTTCLILAFVAMTGPPAGAAVDLSSWTVVDYDVSGIPPGEWVLSQGNTVATQTLNCDPTMLLNNHDSSFYVVAGSLQVMTGEDNDMIGLTFGYQDSSHFYVIDWKQTEQLPAFKGFSVKRISAPSPDSLTSDDFWSSSGTQYSTILASNFGPGTGWSDFTGYGFRLQFETGDFHITIKEGETELWDATVEDGTYPSGQFGLYDFSQEQVRYRVESYSETPTSAPGPVDEVSLLTLYGNAPNPFNPTTTIRFALGEPQTVTLCIYSASGQKVASLIRGEVLSGLQSVIWNGRDSKGREVSSGTYFYRLEAGLSRETRRMTLMK